MLVTLNAKEIIPSSSAAGRCASFTFSIAYFHTASERLLMLFKAEEHERIEGESRLVRIAIVVNIHKPGFLDELKILKINGILTSGFTQESVTTSCVMSSSPGIDNVHVFKTSA